MKIFYWQQFVAVNKGKVLDEIQLFVQFVIETVSSSLTILIIFAGIFHPKLLLQSISFIHFNTYLRIKTQI